MESPSDAHDKKRTGWFATLFSKNNPINEINTSELTSESAAQQAQADKIEALLESVNSASQHARNFYITFLLASFYIAVIIWSTTDVMLLKETPIKLPILDVELSITGFYTFAPFFYLLLHFNLLLQLCLLADKIHRFDRAVTNLDDANGRKYYYTRLFAFAFTHTLSGRHHSWFLRLLLTLLVWITIIWLPLGILIGLQVGFLAYHSEDILFWQRLVITLDLFILAIFWPIIRATDGNGPGWIKQATGLPWLKKLIRWLKTKTINKNPAVQSMPPVNHISGRPMLEGGFSVVTVISVLAFSWLVAVLPDSSMEKHIARIIPEHWKTMKPLRPSSETGRYFVLTEYLFDRVPQKNGHDDFLRDEYGNLLYKESIFNRNLVLREQLLIANELKAEDEADISSKNEEERRVALKKVEKLILSGRDFRYADFSEARLPKVAFFGANKAPSDLRHANFSDAMLTSALMSSVKLQSATLKNAKLQNAILDSANLMDAKLDNAKLQGANLYKANLQGASLYKTMLHGSNLAEAMLQKADLYIAELQGAELSSTNLQGAEIERTKLQSANLYKAKLQGANLYKAKLQGANLYKAKLQGASLTKAYLQGANLNKAKLQGAILEHTNLMGANLSKAYLQDADLTNAILTLSDITETKFSKMSDQELNELLEEMSGIIPETEMSGEIKDANLLGELKTRLLEATQEPVAFVKAQGQKIWAEKPKDFVYNMLHSFENNLKAAKDKSDYQNSLAAYLIDLSCQNKWTTVGIINERIKERKTDDSFFLLKTSFAQCLLKLKNQKNKSDQLVCPALSETDENTTEILKQMVARKESEESIQKTFKCRTVLSDPPSDRTSQ